MPKLLKTIVLGTCALGMVAVAPMTAFAQATGAPAGEEDSVPSSFSLSTGITYSSGDYGEIEATEVFAIPISATYRRGDLRIRVSVPWVQINGPGSLLSTPDLFDVSGGGGGNSGSGSSNSGSGNSGSGNSGSGNSGSGNSGSGSGGSVQIEDDDDLIDDDNVTGPGGFLGADNSRSGFGDINVALAYSLALGESTWFEPSARIKLPTASRTDRLGTGEIDLTLAADLVQQLGDASVYIHGRRRFVGKPEGSTIGSTWGAGAGASLSAGGGVSLGADYFWQESAFALRPASSELSGWVSGGLSDGFRLTAYAGTGLNVNSANFFGGLTISKRF